MSLRCSRSPLSTLRRLTLALLLCAVSGSISAWAAIGASRGPAASAAVTIPAPATKSPALVLVSQEPSWVGPSQPSLSLTVATNQSGSGLTVGLTFYGRVVTRSSFTQALSGSPAQGVLLHTTPVAVAGGEAHTTVCADISPTEGGGAAPPNSTCPPDSPRVDLDCVAGSGSCDGVYPVTITLARQGSTVSRITTFVTYDEPQASSVPKPLRVALVMPLNLSTSFTPSADGAQALVTPTKANATALSQVVSDLDQQSTVPTTILTTGRTVQTLRLAGRSGRDALEQLSDLSGGGGATAVSQMPSQGYVPFNPGQLVASGL